MQKLLLVFRNLSSISAVAALMQLEAGSILHHAVAISNIAEGAMRYAVAVQLPSSNDRQRLSWLLLPSAIFSFEGSTPFWAAHSAFFARKRAARAGEYSFPDDFSPMTLVRYEPEDFSRSPQDVFHVCACELERKLRQPLSISKSDTL